MDAMEGWRTEQDYDITGIKGDCRAVTEERPRWVRPKVHGAQSPVFRQWPMPGF
ncbi:unnamed protein product [Lepidochelys kempii]